MMSGSENPYASPQSVEAFVSPASPPISEPNRQHELKRLRIPAVLNLVISAVMCTFILGTMLQIANIYDPSNYRPPTLISSIVRSYGVLIAVGIIVGLFVSFLTTVCMLNGRYWRYCVAANYLGCLPFCTAGWPLSLLLVIWIASRLHSEGVRQAFALTADPGAGASVRVVNRLFWPTSLLLFVQLVSVILIGITISADYIYYTWGPPEPFGRVHQTMQDRDGLFLFTFLAWSFLTIAIAFSAIQVLRGRNYVLCLIFIGAAMLPIFSPGIVIGIPLAIWTFVLLLRKETRAAFAKVS